MAGTLGELPVVLGRSMLWAEILPTRLPASAKVMLATKTMRTACCIAHVVVNVVEMHTRAESFRVELGLV